MPLEYYVQREVNKGLYVVARIFILLLLNCSAWGLALPKSCLSRHTNLFLHLCRQFRKSYAQELNCELPSQFARVPSIQACTIGSWAGRQAFCHASAKSESSSSSSASPPPLLTSLSSSPSSSVSHALLFFEGRKSRKTTTTM